MSRGLAGLLLLSLAACNDDEQGKLKLSDYDGGAWPEASTKPKDAGSDAQTDAGDAQLGDGGAGGGPVVMITSPVAVSDPFAGPVLTSSSVNVQCQVTQRPDGTPVDPASVRVQVFTDGTSPVFETAASFQQLDLFAVAVPLVGLPSGPVRFRCTAADTSDGAPQTGYGEVTTFYDAGPVITFSTLTNDSIVPRGDDRLTDVIDMPIVFKVEKSPLSLDDPGAEIDPDSVTLNVRGMDLQLAPPEGTEYSKGIDFATFLGTEVIDSIKIIVTAANRRSPNPAVVTKEVTVRIDGEAPTITVTSPTYGAIVGGRVRLQMTISDELSGVSEDGKLTFVVLGDKPNERKFMNLAHDGPNYELEFEASQFPNKSNIPINITSVDNKGNEATASWLVKFDTVPPFVSLASPYVRVCDPTPKTCSARFHALGNSPQDGQVIFDDVRFRTLVFERGIIVTGQEQIWISGVNTQSVKLYAQADSSTPLLLGTNGVCDRVNSDPLPGMGTRPKVHAFRPVPERGTLPPSGTGDSNDLGADPVAPSGYGPVMGNPAPAKCGSELSYVLTQPIPGRPTALYALEPAGDLCTGISFNLGTGAGWTCIVATALDNSGNLGISQPIRVCRYLNTGDCADPPPASLTCTDGCTLPETSSPDAFGTRVFPF